MVCGLSGASVLCFVLLVVAVWLLTSQLHGVASSGKSIRGEVARGEVVTRGRAHVPSYHRDRMELYSLRHAVREHRYMYTYDTHGTLDLVLLVQCTDDPGSDQDLLKNLPPRLLRGAIHPLPSVFGIAISTTSIVDLLLILSW